MRSDFFFFRLLHWTYPSNRINCGHYIDWCFFFWDFATRKIAESNHFVFFFLFVLWIVVFRMGVFHHFCFFFGKHFWRSLFEILLTCWHKLSKIKIVESWWDLFFKISSSFGDSCSHCSCWKVSAFLWKGSLFIRFLEQRFIPGFILMLNHLWQLILPEKNFLHCDTFLNQIEELKQSHFFLTLRAGNFWTKLFDITQTYFVHFSIQTQYFGIDLPILFLNEFLLSKDADGIDNSQSNEGLLLLIVINSIKISIGECFDFKIELFLAHFGPVFVQVIWIFFEYAYFLCYFHFSIN